MFIGVVDSLKGEQILVLISAHTLLHHPKNSLEDLRDLCVDFLHRLIRYDLIIYLCLGD